MGVCEGGWQIRRMHLGKQVVVVVVVVVSIA